MLIIQMTIILYSVRWEWSSHLLKKQTPENSPSGSIRPTYKSQIITLVTLYRNHYEYQARISRNIAKSYCESVFNLPYFEYDSTDEITEG